MISGKRKFQINQQAIVVHNTSFHEFKTGTEVIIKQFNREGYFCFDRNGEHWALVDSELREA